MQSPPQVVAVMSSVLQVVQVPSSSQATNPRRRLCGLFCGKQVLIGGPACHFHVHLARRGACRGRIPCRFRVHVALRGACRGRILRSPGRPPTAARATLLGLFLRFHDLGLLHRLHAPRVSCSFFFIAFMAFIAAFMASMLDRRRGQARYSANPSIPGIKSRPRASPALQSAVYMVEAAASCIFSCELHACNRGSTTQNALFRIPVLRQWRAPGAHCARPGRACELHACNRGFAYLCCVSGARRARTVRAPGAQCAFQPFFVAGAVQPLKQT